MPDFILNSRLEHDSFFVVNLDLCQVRLMNNQEFIWFILIPQINDIVHITDLSLDNQMILIQEINQTAKILQKLFTPTRLNIAAIGNIVAQMHWHIVVRYDTDTAWPNPVWGSKPSLYAESQENTFINLFKNALLETSQTAL